MLTAQIEGSAVPAEELFFEPELVARGSTAAAPVGSTPASEASRRRHRMARTDVEVCDLSHILQ